MAVWEIVVLIVVSSICVCGGIGFVYSSIVNTVERYQIRKAKRDLEIFTKIFEKIPAVFLELIKMAKQMDEEERKRKAEERKNLRTDDETFI